MSPASLDGFDYSLQGDARFTAWFLRDLTTTVGKHEVERALHTRAVHLAALAWDECLWMSKRTPEVNAALNYRPSQDLRRVAELATRFLREPIGWRVDQDQRARAGK